MQDVGCRDVVKEVGNENRVDYVMNTLLYSSRLHKTFQAAYGSGQKEIRESSGYGDRAMTIYKLNKITSPGM